MKVFYRCEGEMGRVAQPQDLDDLLDTFRVEPGAISEEEIHDIRGALDIWGGYQGTHEFGRFVIVTAPGLDDITHEDYQGENSDLPLPEEATPKELGEQNNHPEDAITGYCEG